MEYKPKVYKTSGGDTLNIASGGELQIGGTAFITSGGGVNIGSLTSGDVSLPGALSVSSGLAVTGASTFAAAVSFSSGIAVTGQSTFAETVAFSTSVTIACNLAITSGMTATTGSFSSSVTVGCNLAITSGLTATTGTFSSAVTVGHTLGVSSGITGTSGGFSADVAVTSGITALKGVFTSAVNGTTGKFTGDLSALGFVSGITVGTSSGGALTLASLMTVKSTAGDPVVYTVEPQAGYICYIRCAASCATTGAAIVTTTGTWDGSNANLLFSTGVSNPQFVGFIGLSTSRWQVLTTAYTTEVSFTNT